MTNKTVAKSLKETAALIELTGGNPFRSRAMSNAARTIERLGNSVRTLIEAGTLTEIRGIGKGLEEQISELLSRGSFALRDDLLGGIPPGVLDILSIKGLGAKKVRELWKKLGIQTLEDLEASAASGRIASISGFGEKTQASILINITALRSYRSRRHFAPAFLSAEDLLTALRDVAMVSRAELVGEVRRGFETIGVVDILVSGPGASVDILKGTLEAAAGPLVEAESSKAKSSRVGSFEVTEFSGTICNGLPLYITVCEEKSFGSVQFLLSGSEEFLAEWESRHGAVQAFAVESELFDSVLSAPIPAEIRDGIPIVEEATNGSLAPLIEERDLRGTLHNHSTYSDGAHTLREMAEKTRSMGLSYFGICDHSQSLKIAYGLSPDEVYRQHEEIKLLNAEFANDGGSPFRIFAGIESDILKDGQLDYDDEVLASFDFVVASVHTGFNMTEAEATDRVITAVSNPFTTILGHPTGRLLLRREGYPLDHEAVLDACSEHGVAIELNANPYRLDLDWRWIEMARAKNIMISINPDAHAMDQLAYHRWGVVAARKGRLTAAGCLNVLTLESFGAHLANRPTPDE